VQVVRGAVGKPKASKKKGGKRDKKKHKDATKPKSTGGGEKGSSSSAGVGASSPKAAKAGRGDKTQGSKPSKKGCALC
jgi:hypothetical protein